MLPTINQRGMELFASDPVFLIVSCSYPLQYLSPTEFLVERHPFRSVRRCSIDRPFLVQYHGWRIQNWYVQVALLLHCFIV